jgi:hypothetical protein
MVPLNQRRHMHKLPLAAVSAALFLSSTAVFADSRTLDVSAFTGVEITSGIAAEISIGGPLAVTAEAPGADDFDRFRYEISGGVLKVWHDWDIFHLFDATGSKVKLTITVPSLNSITGTTSARVEAQGPTADALTAVATTGARVSISDAAARQYTLSSTTGASLIIAGDCASADAEVTTGSSIDAAQLLCADVSVEATTGGHLSITATDSVGGDVTTGAGVTVHGGPEVNEIEADTGGSVDIVAAQPIKASGRGVAGHGQYKS